MGTAAWKAVGTLPNVVGSVVGPYPTVVGLDPFWRDILTAAACTPEGCTFCGWALAFCCLHRSCDEPFCCRFSGGTRIWCTGTLGNIAGESGKTGPP